MLDARFRPLERWPRKRTPDYSRRRSTFRARYSDTLDMLEKELGYLNAKNVVVEADFATKDIRNDGWPKSSARPKTSSVILSFESKHGALSLPCDHFDAWEDNLRAIAFHLHHLRKSDLYGVTQGGEQYKGWAALPAAGESGISTVASAAQFLSRHGGYGQVTIEQSSETCETAYRCAARKLHPDAGGENHLFQQLQVAIGILRKHHGVRQ
jgi:hypothetical protein